MKKIIVMLLVAVTGFGQEQQKPIQDLTLLIGKQVIVQRMAPLCQPGTYTAFLTYAGKQAKVVSLKPSKIAPLSPKVMNLLLPETRAMIEDAQKAATILLQFEDGTQLDTCVPIGPSKFFVSFELAPGQTLPDSFNSPTASAPPTSTAGTLVPATLTNPKQPTDVLSDDEVKQALSGTGADHNVVIEDNGLRVSLGKQVPRIVLYMPESILAIGSKSATKQFTQYHPTEEDKRRSLTIDARGYAGNTITEGCTSITRVVLLSDRSGGVVQEAYLSEPLAETWRNDFGATNQCQALEAKFSLDDVHKVRAAAPNGEFFVAVFAGSTNTKMYKIKKKFQSSMGLK
jgi:hypothetical protein